MSESKHTRRPGEEASTGASPRKLIGFYEVPEDFADMTDEEIGKLAAAIVAEFRDKTGRPSER